jgi:hypothetical protein
MKIKLQMSENMLQKKWLAVKWQLYAHLKKNYFSLSLTPKYNIDVKQACISLCMSMWPESETQTNLIIAPFS